MHATLKIILFSLIFLTANAQAKIIQCVGMDDKGATLNVEFNSDPKAETLIVNGITHKIEAPTKDRSGLATENYTAEKNVLVYDSFIKGTAGHYNLHRFNAMTDETIFDKELVCSVK